MRRKAQRRTPAKAGLWTVKTTATQSKAAMRHTIRRTGNASIPSEHCAHGRPPSPGKGYIERARVLLEIGFATYREYLDSELWGDIKSSVLESASGKCRMCGNPAFTVHHKSYKKDVMLGRRPDLLVATCHSCHKTIERDADGGKTSLEEANRRLAMLMESGKRVRDKVKHKKPDTRKKKPARLTRKEKLRLKCRELINQPRVMAIHVPSTYITPAQVAAAADDRRSIRASDRWKAIVKKSLSV